MVQQAITITETAGFLKVGSIIFYDDSARISRGATGALYHVPENGAVVRIPEREAAISPADFRTEFTILDALRSTGEEPPALSPAALGETEDGRPALVTPYYERTLWSRLRRLIDSSPLEAERLMLEAALAFADVMARLRYNTVYAAIERKVRDFFVTPEGRVIVTGWGNVQEQSPEFCAAEVALFGSIGYELLTGLIAPKRLNPFDDLPWQPLGMPAIEGGPISVGLRALLAAALNLPPAIRFPDSDGLPSYQPLSEALKKWKAVLALQEPAPDEMLAALQAFYATLPAQALPDARLKEIVRADIVWRLNRQPEAWTIRQTAFEALQALLTEQDASLTAMADILGIVPPEIIAEEAASAPPEEGIATDIPAAAPVPAVSAYDRNRARRRLIETLLDNIPAAGASAETQTKIHTLLDDIRARLETSPSEDTPDSLNELRGLLNEVETPLNNLKVETTESVIPLLRQEVALREKAIDYRTVQSLHIRLRRFRELVQAASTIPYLLADKPAPEEITPLEDILGYSGILTTLEALFEQPMVQEQADNQTLLNRLDEMQQAYRLCLALADVHDREWLRDDLAPYIAYMRFVRQYYATTRHDAAALSAAFLSAEAMLDNPHLQKPTIAMTIRRMVLRYLQIAYNRMVEACQVGLPAEVNTAAELWAAMDSHATFIKAVLAEREHYPADDHPLTRAGQRPGGAWALLRIQGEQCRDVDALYDDWLKMVGQDSVYRFLQVEPDRDRLTALLKLFDRMQATPGVNMSEILGQDDGLSVDEFRQMIAKALDDAKASVEAAHELMAQVQRRADEVEENVEMRIQRRLEEVRSQNWFKDAIDDQISNEFRQFNALAARFEALNKYVDDRTQNVEREITGRISRIEIVIKQLDALTEDMERVKQQQDTTGSRLADIQSSIARLTRLETTLDGKIADLRRQLFTQFLDWMEKNTLFATPEQYVDALNRMHEEMERCPPEIFAREHPRWERLYMALRDNLTGLLRQNGRRGAEREAWLKEVEARARLILDNAKQKAAVK